ncbi:MAG TPA: RuBisCO large subunit C-terminal-like domain-containing protein [Myxococcota bacterium]|nr:RuBisCO large subunit C-terminal-like domain-containing protein [Myxococcota bacterium]
MELLRVSYRLDGHPADAESRAEAIALEQTVEVPRAVAMREPFIKREIVGRVESIDEAPDGSQRVSIAYPVATTALDPAQLLGVLFGNTSLHADVACVDFDPPPSLCDALRGPRAGIAGLRELTGVRERALSCTAVKPLGRTPEALAELLGAFARAGIDVIKDDQGLADHEFCPFEARVEACLAAAEQVADETGHRALYVPNLIGTPERVFAQLRYAEKRGARAVMVSPMLLGLPTFWELCHRRASVPVLAHPSHAGVQRYAAELLFGKLLRLYGADAVIFVGYAGRFGIPRATCAAIAANLRGAWHGIAPSLPVPGGGIELRDVPDAVEFYGRDAMLLVGGSLQLEPGRVLERSRAFAAAVADASR